MAKLYVYLFYLAVIFVLFSCAKSVPENSRKISDGLNATDKFIDQTTQGAKSLAKNVDKAKTEIKSTVNQLKNTGKEVRETVQDVSTVKKPNLSTNSVTKKKNQAKGTANNVNRAGKEVKKTVGHVTPGSKTAPSTTVNKVKNGTSNAGNLISVSGKRKNFSTSSPKPITYSGGVELTKQIFIQVPGEYPEGYEPKWIISRNYMRMFSANDPFVVNVDDYLIGNVKKYKQPINPYVIEYQGESVLYFNTSYCKCVAALDIPVEKLTLNNTPIRFGLKNFRKFAESSGDDPNAPCQGLFNYTQGGWAGYITLSADSQGNMEMDIELQNFAAPKFRNGIMTFRYYDTNVSIPLMMSADQAIAHKKREEQLAEEQRLAKIAREKEEAERERLLEIEIKDSYKKVLIQQANYTNVAKSSCLEEAYGSRSSYEKERYYTTPIYRPRYGANGEVIGNDLVGGGEIAYRDKKILVSYKAYKNICDHRVTILGISKKRSKKGTIYYEDASVYLEPGDLTDIYHSKLEKNVNPKDLDVGQSVFFINKIKR